MTRPVTSPVRIGVLGAAKVAPSALLLPSREVDGVEVVAVASRDPHRARAFARTHSIEHVFDDYERMLGDPGIDAIYVALPASLHARWTIAALQAGKHVLCEKPFTSNAEAASRVAAVAASSDATVMEAYHSSYHPIQAQLRAILDSGEIGRVVSARAEFCIPLISRRAVQWNAELGGGGLLDVGYYPVRQLRELFGEPTRILSARAWTLRDVDRRLDASLEFADGVRGAVISSILSRRLLTSSLVIRGEAGAVTVSWPYHPQSGARLTVQTRTGASTRLVDRRSSYLFQLEAFRDCVQTGTAPRTGPREAVAQLTTIDDLYTAAGLRPRPDAASTSAPQ
nr:Oxidoreductase family, NAD-binding Rossmann fold [uncultured organism]